MSYESFWILHDKLEDGIHSAVYAVRGKPMPSADGGGREGGNYSAPPTPNGPILISTRLAVALRFFAGASNHDLVTNFEISQTEVVTSIWAVVEAVNKHPEFRIEYPSDHNKQRMIAEKFCAASDVGFNNCAGCLDGVLIWMPKPSIREAKEANISRRKLLCARKNKFGLNMQAVADMDGRILDMSIKCGGASSDLLAFEKSDLHRRLEAGLLADGLAIYGDNAYVNTNYMATPYPGVTQGARDKYNFFHSQVSCCNDLFTVN